MAGENMRIIINGGLTRIIDHCSYLIESDIVVSDKKTFQPFSENSLCYNWLLFYQTKIF